MKHFQKKSERKIKDEAILQKVIDLNLPKTTKLDNEEEEDNNNGSMKENETQSQEKNVDNLENFYQQYQTQPQFDNYNETIETFEDSSNQQLNKQKEVDEFNIENIKNDLENYLDSQNQQNYTIDQQYKNSNFGDEKTNLQDNYDTSFFEQSQEKKNDPEGNLYKNAKKTKLDSCNTQNKLRYEEWVYKDENTMNGTELFDGIFAYDNMVDNYCSFGK